MISGNKGYAGSERSQIGVWETYKIIEVTKSEFRNQNNGNSTQKTPKEQIHTDFQLGLKQKKIVGLERKQ